MYSNINLLFFLNHHYELSNETPHKNIQLLIIIINKQWIYQAVLRKSNYSMQKSGG